MPCCQYLMQKSKEFILKHALSPNSVVVIVNRIEYNNINIVIVVGNLGDAIMSDINVLLEKAVNETARTKRWRSFFAP